MWLPEHVRSRYASGHVIVIPADHRGYEHSAPLPEFSRMSALVFTVKRTGSCATLRPAPICDCGMYALDWVGSGPRDETARTNGDKRSDE